MIEEPRAKLARIFEKKSEREKKAIHNFFPPSNSSVSRRAFRRRLKQGESGTFLA